MCLLRAKKDFPKGTRPQEYGVLLHNMAEDSICGTCVMEDGRFETIPWGKLKLAFKRIHESSYKIADVMKTACNLLYLAAKADHATLNKKIKDCERDYFAFMDAAYAERRNKRGAKRKLGETTTSQPNKTGTISLGTQVSMYFTWSELGPPSGGPGAVKLTGALGEDDDGQHRTGVVTQCVQNKYRRWTYTCTFDTPQKHIFPMTTDEMRKGMAKFAELRRLVSSNEQRDTHDRDRSAKRKDTLDPYVVAVGTDVCMWVLKTQLPSHVKTNAGGLWITGQVKQLQIGQKGEPRCMVRFVAPYHCEQTFSMEEVTRLRQNYAREVLKMTPVPKGQSCLGSTILGTQDKISNGSGGESRTQDDHEAQHAAAKEDSPIIRPVLDPCPDKVEKSGAVSDVPPESNKNTVVGAGGTFKDLPTAHTPESELRHDSSAKGREIDPPPISRSTTNADPDTINNALSDNPRRSRLNLQANKNLRNGTTVVALPPTQHALYDAAAESLLPPNLTLHPVPRDGNCMFHAILVSSGVPGTTHWDLRKNIVDHVISNWDDTEMPYSYLIRTEHPEETQETYRARMLGRNKDWGDFPELVAASTLLGRDIDILDYQEGAETLGTTPISTRDAEHPLNGKIVLLRVAKTHYHALVETLPLYSTPPAPLEAPPGPKAGGTEDTVRSDLATFFTSLQNGPPRDTGAQEGHEMESDGDTNNRTKTAEKHGLKRELVANPSVSKIVRPPLQTFTSCLNDKEGRSVAESNDFDDLNQSGNDDSDDFADRKPPVQKCAKDAQLPVPPVAIKRDRAVRSQDRTNKSEKNWTTAMKRHWQTQQKEKAMELITIKRNKLDEVYTHYIHMHIRSLDLIKCFPSSWFRHLGL